MIRARLIFALLVAATLAGCALPGGHRPAGSSVLGPDPGNSLADTNNKLGGVHLTLIRDMLANGQYYAALAHIQAARQDAGPGNLQLRLLEADTRRNLGQNKHAEKLYLSLLGTAMNGQALHGLGLLRAHQGNLPQAIADLEKAAQELPTKADIRNDLGYALMQAGNYQAAFPQLSTAAELQPHAMRSRRNLIILMYLMGRPTDAARMGAKSGLDHAQLQQLEQQARTMQNQQSHVAG